MLTNEIVCDVAKYKINIRNCFTFMWAGVSVPLIRMLWCKLFFFCFLFRAKCLSKIYESQFRHQKEWKCSQIHMPFLDWASMRIQEKEMPIGWVWARWRLSERTRKVQICVYVALIYLYALHYIDCPHLFKHRESRERHTQKEKTDWWINNTHTHL